MGDFWKKYKTLDKCDVLMYKAFSCFLRQRKLVKKESVAPRLLQFFIVKSICDF